MMLVTIVLIYYILTINYCYCNIETRFILLSKNDFGRSFGLKFAKNTILLKCMTLQKVCILRLFAIY